MFCAACAKLGWIRSSQNGNYAASFALGLIIMLVSYPAIAVRLYRQHRRLSQAPASATSHNAAGQMESKLHVKTLKIYVAILVLFLATVIPVAILSRNTNANRWIVYIYYINNIGNPFIYYVFNDRFRDEVKVVLRSMCRCSRHSVGVEK